jgi:NADPH2:quinone reductase
VLECSPKGVDLSVEVEFGGNIGLIPKIMRPLGTVFIYGSGKNMAPQFPFGEYLFKSLKLNIVLVYLMPMRLRKRLVNVLHDAYENNALSPSIDSIYDFSECAKAHERVMKPGRNGTVLLKIDRKIY